MEGNGENIFCYVGLNMLVENMRHETEFKNVPIIK
jgi:hypothetical protein